MTAKGFVSLPGIEAEILGLLESSYTAKPTIYHQAEPICF